MSWASKKSTNKTYGVNEIKFILTFILYGTVYSVHIAVMVLSFDIMSVCVNLCIL